MAGMQSDFYRFLAQRGQIDPQAQYRHFSPYLTYFEPGRRVLDVGCGEGQFLELLRDKGCVGIGVDSDPGMVALCCKKGLTVVQEDAFVYLRNSPNSFDGVFAANFIEHLAQRRAIRLLELCHRALRSGGTLLIATPNPASIIVHLHEFWRDATHIRLYSLPLLEFIVSQAGFELVSSGENDATRSPQVEKLWPVR